MTAPAFVPDWTEEECPSPLDEAPRCTITSHREAVLDDARWQALPFVYVWILEPGTPGMEGRNCTCGSTLHRELPGPVRR